MAHRRLKSSTMLSGTTLSRSKSMFSVAFDDITKGRANAINHDKAKITQLLKTTHLEQLSKLQNKHQQECDLLDEIRNFGKQRSQIERDYGQALQKLAQQYQKRDLPPQVEGEGPQQQKHVLTVWKCVLDATDKAGQARINASENYKNNIYEAAKNFRTHKDINLKKCQELLNNLQNEISETIKDLAKAKKKYYELEQVAAMARDKYQEVNDRLKKNQISIFKSKAGLEKAFQKLQQKCDESTTSSTIARNEYILMLAAANTHQRRYYEADLPQAMGLLDGDVFKKFQTYLSLLCQYELDTCSAVHEAYDAAQDSTTQISRDYNTRCFLRENPIFEWGPSYEFEACGDDGSDGKLTEEQSGNDNSLNREARKWSYRFVRDERQLQRLRKIRQGLEGLIHKYNETPELNSEASAQETEVRLEKCKEDLRKMETCKLQCEARLDLLREANVDIDTWIESAKAQLVKEASESVSTPGRPKSVRKTALNQLITQVDGSRVNGSSVGEADESFFDDDYTDDFEDTFDEEPITFNMDRDDLSLPSSEHSRNYPVTCSVIYPYKATRADELTISIGDRVDVVEDGDLDQWVKARNSSGQLGYVPENYLQFPAPSTGTTPHHYALPPSDEDYTNTMGSSSSSTSGTSSLTVSSTSGNDREVSNIIYGAGSHRTYPGVCLAKAIYEYEACSNEELGFPEGAIINILTKDDNGVDDGWWKGELNGKIGVFPGLVVEEIGSEVANVGSSSLPVFIFTLNLFLLKSYYLSKNYCRLKVSLFQESPTSDGPPSFRPPPPSECPPPPPQDGSIIRSNQSWGSNLHRNSPVNHSKDLGLPEVRHERANSAPASPVYANRPKPHRAAPAPPQRPSLFNHRET
ncbi:unnamed protein product [Clavelina lepadiformis]|uniref:F-BAR and double SH3 domains protein 2 n=1 Tax=Clavelina lepadiformis TaxID=159417 RepID=A0ABP0G3G9_CLALP